MLRGLLVSSCLFFFFNDTATTEIYTLSLHDALPISTWVPSVCTRPRVIRPHPATWRSEEHTSELQSRQYLVCRLLLEKKKTLYTTPRYTKNYKLCNRDRKFELKA